MHTFQVTGTTVGGFTREVPYSVEEIGDTLKLVVRRETLCDPHYQEIRVHSSLTTVQAGTSGYMFYPTDFRNGFVMTHFTKNRPNALFRTWPTATLVAGLCGNPDAVYVRIDGEAFDGRFEVEHRDGVYTLNPHFRFDGDTPDEDVVIVYKRMPNATYVDMAKVHRKYQMDFRGCRPLRERVEEREELRLAIDRMEIRVRLGWKPIPTPVRHQNLENEPDMYVACDIPALHKILDSMQAKGVTEAEFCLVGWGEGGHDGRFPQQYPCDERFGGDTALKKFIARAQRLGYQVVCHTVTCGSYEIANNFDRDLLTKKKGPNGDLVPYVREHYIEKGLNGGEPYHLCAKTAYENYAVHTFPKVRGYGFRGIHYNDELTAYIPEKCYDPKHPCTRKEAWEYHRKVAQLCRDLFGGFQSEGWMDYMSAEMDAILYIGCNSKITPEIHPLYDEGIPFWQLVYHGIILSNPTAQTINYPIKEKYQNLKFIEYGGRPLMYFNSKFGADRNWMGDLDLHSQSDEDIDVATDALKRAYDEYQPLKYLQYEFMENHEKLAEGVYRTTYSDGTVITVDYNKEIYTVEKTE